MAAYIQNIATAVPQNYFEQDFLRDQMKSYLDTNEVTRRIIHRIYSKSGIEKRHTVVNDFRQNGAPRFFFQKDGNLSEPSTGQRNDLYIEKGKQLFIETAEKTIRQNNTVTASDITHVITVSCTGFFSPEPGFEIIKALDLPPSTPRFHLGFMGCFAAFPAIKMAKSFCDTDPEANVLVVCLELCSIHLQNSSASDQLISASVFGDGAAGMIISSSTNSSPSLKCEQLSTSIAENSEKDMAWTIGDTGFDMVLSSYVPDIIDANLADAIAPLFEDYNLKPADIQHWAVHPGGRAILDKIENSFELRQDQIASPRKILSEYGNMSSATILFVLADLLEKPAADINSESILAMAFGPGLTIESALLSKV